jgi:hypothetical protein
MRRFFVSDPPLPSANTARSRRNLQHAARVPQTPVAAL